ncbi:hypothetical protein UFOVP75_89 [uncultured Caudovirales phage]|uniref:Recombination endonuclease VII n=1 Tax=uncultured Caudovirales phage TaxID=2100421 RepID=A0A6J5L1Z3_9CAUD|nr:hypothetical protein UFOVP75_89 [uncultured Caudovirales phage]
MDTYLCTQCDKTKPEQEFHLRSTKDRPVSYVCRECRSGRDRTRDSFVRASKKYATVCNNCNWPRALATNGTCHKCLREMGLKQCETCFDILAKELSFRGRDNSCTFCRGIMPKVSLDIRECLICKEKIANPLDLTQRINDICGSCKNGMKGLKSDPHLLYQAAKYLIQSWSA